MARPSAPHPCLIFMPLFKHPTSIRYTGRFAPSPTGALHLGSLSTALASWLDAKAHHGLWYLRIEDIDPPREQHGASTAIIQSLRAHGLCWDGDILFQSTRLHAYQQALEQLQAANHCFYCRCSRQSLASYTQRTTTNMPIPTIATESYPGFCRAQRAPYDTPCAIRLKTNEPYQAFTDRLLGLQTPATLPPQQYADFVIQRKDGLFAYQLACVVDDIAQGVNACVRGSDILDSTFKQAYLYRYFQQMPPSYLHLPVINNAQGQKLSKQNHAPALNNDNACNNLLIALTHLRQPLPPTTQRSAPASILQWAVAHWDIHAIPAVAAI